MSQRAVVFLLCFLPAAPVSAATPADRSLLGFTAEAARAQRAREAQLDSFVRAEDLREWMRRLSARPHHVGSAYGKENAEYLAGLFRSWGYDTRIEEFSVLFPVPTTRLLEMVAPTRFKARLAEPALKEDATSGQASEQLPTYNAYSKDGDVTGDLVYVNYGVPADYEELARRGIDVKGKVVLARYGGSWRGIKPKVAAEQGAVGCLIYSDPRDDGYFEGDTYPKGSYRNEHGAQRGSVADMPVYPGDPLTPGVGATKDARRLSLQDAATITKIPVMPISYADAQPLLSALGGPVAPEGWRGALPLTYHLGPGPARVHLKLAFDWKQVPAYDVIAVLKGRERPDQWVIRGNHHDAWVNGAEDPVSGLVALLAEAQALGRLHQAGFSPRRTVVYAAWDGEEQGLLGSTEWAETHAAELRQKAVAYVNSDTNGRGFLYAGGSHSLEAMVNEVAQDVVDPQRKVSVAERARARRILDGSPEQRTELRSRGDLRLAALGSGSDYTPFLQHLGVASLNIGFGGEDGGGSYHSIYDSFDYYTRFGDPSFAYGVALAQVGARVVLRLAEADVLPLTFGTVAETVGRYVGEVEKLADDMRARTEEENRQISERTLEIGADPREPFVGPSPRAVVPFLSFAPLRNALRRVEESAREYDQARAAVLALEEAPSPALDETLLGMERAFTRAEGLPRRPWFRHHIYAPGLYTGYGVKTLPGVREALEQRQWDEVPQQVEIVAGVLQRYAAELDRARSLLPRAPAGAE
jgi:N-acetylated-alpha-linked acidic dipeptidase